MNRGLTWTICRGCMDSVGKFPRPWIGTLSPRMESKRRTCSQDSTLTRRLCSEASPEDMTNGGSPGRPDRCVEWNNEQLRSAILSLPLKMKSCWCYDKCVGSESADNTGASLLLCLSPLVEHVLKSSKVQKSDGKVWFNIGHFHSGNS